MLDPISDTPLVLAYVFMSLLVLIVCFIIFNVVHKVYRGMSTKDTIGVGVGVGVSLTSPLKTTALLEVDAMKTG
ncbi:uncharacterized protein LOC117788601 [Drosophila innubila]|uniref:uncharacterized protein LOC117788601 n=1 Tax=Drosophila innubila TaxID=198719 RepID=UPI00148D3728|nr:uncharacterized protein LOC117788601 [Drosophila innubila]